MINDDIAKTPKFEAHGRVSLLNSVPIVLLWEMFEGFSAIEKMQSKTTRNI